MSWDQARNILAVRLDNLGDVLMTTPAIRALKESLPGRRITLLASKSGARAASHVPEIDRVIAYDAPWVKHPMPTSALSALALRDVLAMERFVAAGLVSV